MAETERVLVVGFSVTAEYSYVEVSRKRIPSDTSLVIDKVAMGGWFPFDLSYVLQDILEKHKPDHLVLEIATSSLRTGNSSKEDHAKTLETLVASCARAGTKRVSFLDLPRQDVEDSSDWLFAMHKTICEEYGLGYKHVPYQDGILRDVVHASEAGREVFADALMALVNAPVTPNTSYWSLQHAKQKFASIDAYRCAEGEVPLRNFSRSGFGMDMVEIHEKTSVAFRLDDPGFEVVAVTTLFGPKTGRIKLTSDDTTLQKMSYDGFSYYERLETFYLAQPISANFRIEQLPDIPDVELRKGEKDLGPRCGYIGSFWLKAR